MKILFKADSRYYFIIYNQLCWNTILETPSVNLDNIPHLNDMEILYQYRGQLPTD